MEKEWQGNMPLAINNSITPTWVRGLQGRTLGELCSALDTYVAQNPDKMEDSVAGTLGRLFVAPKLTQSEKEVARAHYRQIKSNK